MGINLINRERKFQKQYPYLNFYTQYTIYIYICMVLCVTNFPFKEQFALRGFKLYTHNLTNIYLILREINPCSPLCNND